MARFAYDNEIREIKDPMKRSFLNVEFKLYLQRAISKMPPKGNEARLKILNNLETLLGADFSLVIKDNKGDISPR
jgi:hypothetical protein